MCLLGLLFFLFWPHFCPALSSVESCYQCITSLLSHSPNYRLKTRFPLQASQVMAPVLVMCSAGPGDGVVSSLFPRHCLFLAHKINKRDRTDHPPVSLKHTQSDYSKCATFPVKKSPTILLGSLEFAPTWLSFSLSTKALIIIPGDLHTQVKDHQTPALLSLNSLTSRINFPPPLRPSISMTISLYLLLPVPHSLQNL